MPLLYILYDDQCALCRQCRRWLSRQRSFFELRFIAMRSPEATTRFPGIEQHGLGEELLVVTQAGAVYRGAAAWIMCLYALREFRAWSFRLAQPALQPLARRICALISENRLRLSRWLFQAEAEAIKQAVEAEPVAWCETAACRAGEREFLDMLGQGAPPPPLPQRTKTRTL